MARCYIKCQLVSRVDSLQLSKRVLGKDYSNASDTKETNQCNNASTNNEKTVLEFKSKCHCLRYLRSRRLEVFGRKKERARESRPRALRSFLRPPAR